LLVHFIFVLAYFFSGVAFAAEVDSGIPAYAVSSGVSGNLSSVGSDTLANLMTLWAEEFKRFLPECKYSGSGRRFVNRTACANRENIESWSHEQRDERQ
jgi:ABC-type phosphate transport system substrate-binding protein